MTAQDLQAFEARVAEAFNNKKILAPIHLDGCKNLNQEKELIRIFEKVRPQDWVCCSWRAHYKILLKKVPPDELFEKILAGKSIGLCFSKYNVISSGIVAGILPIGLGIAGAIKRRGEDARVYVFLGDMTSYTGTYHECATYAYLNDLAITWVVENNWHSVCTPTNEAWGEKGPDYVSQVEYEHIEYDPIYPHSGTLAGRIKF